MHTSNTHKCGMPKSGIMQHPGSMACDRCGEKFRNAAERIRLEGERYICGVCYQGLVVPELVFRHSDLPD